MRVLGLTLTACLILSLSACSGNADKIIGKWEVVKSESGAPVGATLEFTKDGKMTMTMKDPTAIKDQKAKEVTMGGEPTRSRGTRSRRR